MIATGGSQRRPSSRPGIMARFVRKGRPRARTGRRRGARCGCRRRDRPPTRRRSDDRARRSDPHLVPGTSGAGRRCRGRAAGGVRRSPPAAYTYPDDGSAVTVASTNAAATVDDDGEGLRDQQRHRARALRRRDHRRLGARREPPASADTTGADGNFDGTTAQNLRCPRAPRRAGSQIPLADWGTLTIDFQDVEQSSRRGSQSYSGSVAALDITLTADHGGLPAGIADPGRVRGGGAAQARRPLRPRRRRSREPKPTTVETPTGTETTTPRPANDDRGRANDDRGRAKRAGRCRCRSCRSHRA